ncbi:MAG TPA: S8 family serine peptidase [Gemmatimonadales bacterium]|nr:S8 family serine peptidase [Gemmatimonadales bacterium]
MHRATAVRILLITLGVASCTRERTGPVVLVPAALTVSAGNTQSGAAGSALAQPLVALVTAANGEPVGGVHVSWHVRAGGGFVSTPTSTTDDRGHASVLLTVGTSAAINADSVEASVSQIVGAPLLFTASTVAGPAALLAFTRAPSPAAAGTPISPAVQVSVEDAFGNLVTTSGTSIDVALGANPAGGLLSGQTHIATVAGVATFPDLSLDKPSSGYTLVASAANLPAATSAPFLIAPAGGIAARIVITTGNQQTAPAGTALPIAYGIQVTDAYGVRIAGATVTWTIGAGGGSVSTGQGVTDSGGLTSTQRTLGAHAGAQTVVATVQGLADSAATFVASALPNGTISGTITLGSGFLAPPATLRSSWSPPRTTSAAAPQYTPDELIVTYRSDMLAAPPVGSPGLAAPATVAALSASIRSRLAAGAWASRTELRGVSAALLSARLRVVDTAELDQIASALRQDPAVLSVERNGIVHLDAHHAALVPLSPDRARPEPGEGESGSGGEVLAAAATPVVPSEPLYSWQAWDYAMIDLPRAWQITTGSASVLVAVVDNGIRYDHPGVVSNLTHDGYDFVSDVKVNVCGGGTTSNAGDGDGYDADPTMPADYNYDEKNDCVKGLTTSGDHGLHVAGTIGAVGNDGVGTSGINWSVRIRPVRVIGVGGSGSFYDIAQGILYAAGLPADDGKGGTVMAPSAARVINVSLGGASGSSALHNAVIAATNAGALVIAAAGNDGSTSALYPAAYSEALAVSAVGPDGQLASYSTHGSAIDIAAPGGDITDGGGTYGVMSTVWNFVANTPSYDSWDGTSMATPHVSGVAALLLAQNPSLTAAQLRSRLTTWAVDAGPAGADDLYGAGIVNARNSLTQSFAPPAQVYALLYDASTGRLVAQAPTANGAYSFNGLDDGSYLIYGGADENGDGQVAVAGRAWGTLGGSATPSTVTVNGAGTYGASFAIAQPVELEPNNTIAEANALAIPGTMNGTLSTASDVDMVRVLIAQPGAYTFETAAQNGACGFALEANTELALENSNGVVIASNDDIDAGMLNYCSRITATLTPGVYYVAVTGWTAGRYRLTARVGP